MLLKKPTFLDITYFLRLGFLFRVMLQSESYPSDKLKRRKEEKEKKEEKEEEEK